jgi:hypothetical protein
MSLQLLHRPLKLVLHQRHYQTHCVSQSPPPTQIPSLSTSPATNTAPTLTGEIQFNIKVLSCFLVVGFADTLSRRSSSKRLGLKGTFTMGRKFSTENVSRPFPIYEEPLSRTHKQFLERDDYRLENSTRAPNIIRYSYLSSTEIQDFI